MTNISESKDPLIHQTCFSHKAITKVAFHNFAVIVLRQNGLKYIFLGPFETRYMFQAKRVEGFGRHFRALLCPHYERHHFLTPISMRPPND